MASTVTRRDWAAGVWDQSTETEDGVGFVAWSRHVTRELAERAAQRYARAATQPTGGALSWAGGVRRPDGAVYWLDRRGEVRS